MDDAAPACIQSRGGSVSTTRLPSGNSPTAASLNEATPNGMPMIVMQNAMPETMWMIASHQPANRNHSTLPIAEARPAPGARTVVRPNGQTTNPARRNDAIPNGMVTISRQAITPASR